MSDHEPSRSDRVSIDDSVMEIYRALTDSDDLEQSPFQTYKDVFMFAVALGFQNGLRRPLPGGKKSTIRRDVFTDPDIAFLKALAIAETGDVQVLAHFGEILTIAEEYAQAGIFELKMAISAQTNRPLWGLVSSLSN